jgi:hypothetical protein
MRTLVELFHSDPLRPVAAEVERTIVTIMQEVANPEAD